MCGKSPIISAFEWNGRLAQLVRAPSSHGGGHWFESSIAHQILSPSDEALTSGSTLGLFRVSILSTAFEDLPGLLKTSLMVGIQDSQQHASPDYPKPYHLC